MTAPALIAKALEIHVQDRERAIINEVQRKLSTDGSLDPQFAVQKWVAIAELRKLQTHLNHAAQTEIKLRSAT